MSDVRELRCSAPAKINTCLFVGPELPDGRHDLVTVFQTLDLADTITALADPGLGGDVVECPGVSGENLAATALAAYRAETGWDGPPLLLRIEKRIPIAGGMAGGSADAAAALRLAAAFAGDEDRARLRAIAATLGADVPAQIDGGRQLGTGTGAQLRRSVTKPDWEAVIVPVDAALGAGDVYREADRLTPPRAHDDLTELHRAVLAAERAGIGAENAGLAVNDLQTAATTLCPAIEDALALLREQRPEGLMVSGSGPTCFGLFAPGTGAAVAERIGRERPAFVALPEPHGTLPAPRWP